MQAWALLEWRAGNYERAREIFEQAGKNCAPHAPLWAAWAQVEVRPFSLRYKYPWTLEEWFTLKRSHNVKDMECKDKPGSTFAKPVQSRPCCQHHVSTALTKFAIQTEHVTDLAWG